MLKVAKLVAVNERGQRIGESHPRAVLTDHEVSLVLALRDEGCSYGWIARKMEISKSQVARIVRGERRAQLAARWKRVCP